MLVTHGEWFDTSRTGEALEELAAITEPRPVSVNAEDIAHSAALKEFPITSNLR